jgi:hypothetical protein
MRRKVYLVLLLLFVAVAATGAYLRHKAKVTAANCDTPAAPATRPPTLPGFAIGAACGTGTEAPTPGKHK